MTPVDGMTTLVSGYSAAETLGRLKAAIAAAGLELFAHIDHAAAARDAGLDLAPLNLVIYGSPRAGTPLMAHTPTLGIDLPLKALVWQDAEGRVLLSVNDLSWIAGRHRPPAGDGQALAAITSSQVRLAAQVVAAPEAGG